MLDLAAIKFQVDTSELERAQKTIASLAQDFTKIDKASQQAAKTQAQTEAILAKAAKDHAQARKENAKAADTELKSVIAADKADTAREKTVRKTIKATEDQIVSVSKLDALMFNVTETTKGMTEGMSKGNAALIARAKALGATADHLKILNEQQQIQNKVRGGDPFDKSNSGAGTLQKNLTEARAALRYYNDELGLTSKQTRDLARDQLRTIETFKANNKSIFEARDALRSQKEEYVGLASQYNKLASAEQKIISQRKEMAAATEYVTSEEKKMAAALNISNAAIDKAGTDKLVKYESALRKSGLAQDVVTQKLAAYKTQLTQVQAVEEKRKAANLSRSLSPQLTDVAVSLYSGQAPLTVLLQQGGQILDLFKLSGIEAQNFGKAMREAFSSMIPAMWTVIKGMGSFVTGTLMDAGRGIASFIGSVTGLTAAADKLHSVLTADGPSKYLGVLQKINSVASATAAVGFGALIAAAIAAGVALYQVIKQENELVKVLALNSGALGLSKDSATAYAQALSGASGTTGQFIEAIGEMAKTGKFTREEIGTVATAAVQMAKYFDISMSDTVKSFAKLKEDPVKNLIELAKQTGMVSEETIKSVIELEKQGNAAQAASVAIKAMAEVNHEQVEIMKKDYNSFSLYIIELGGKIKQFFSDSFANLWRSNSTDAMRKEIADIDRQIEKLEKSSFANGALTNFLGGMVGGTELTALKAARENLMANLSVRELENAAMEEGNKLRVEAASIQQASIKLTKDAEDAVDKSMKKTLTLEEFRKKFIDKKLEDAAKEANIDKSKIETNKELMALLEKQADVEYKKAHKSDGKQAKKDLETEIDLRNKELGLLSSFNNELDAIERRRKATGDEEQYQASLNALIEKQPVYIARQKEINQAHELSNKLLGQSEGLGKDYYKTLEAIQGYEGDIWNSEQADKARQAAFDMTALAKEQLKYVKDSTEASQKYNAEIQKGLGETQQENQMLDDRVALLGLTSEQARLLSREQDRKNKLLRVELEYQQKIQKLNNDDNLDVFDREFAKIQAAQLRAEQEKAINREVAIQYAEDLDKEIRGIKEGISDSIVTALFEGGKAGSQKLRNVVMDALRKPVTLVVNALVNTLMGSVLGGAASSAAGSAGGSLLGSIATSLGGNALSSSLGISSLFGGATTAASNAALATSLGLGSSSAAAAATGAAVAGGTSAGVAGAASSLGSALSAIPGWGWAIAGIAALAGLMGKKATPHAGAASRYNATGGLQNINLGAANGMGFMANYAAETQGFTDQIAKTLGTALDSTATAFGKTAGYEISAAFADDTSKDGAWGQLIIEQAGKSLVNWGLEAGAGKWAPKEFGDGEAGQKQFMDAIAKDARNALKTAIGDVEWATDMLDALGDSPTIEQLSATVDTINGLKTAFTNLGYNIKAFADLTDEATSALVKASGGAAQLLANTQAFYENFYSDSEKQANVYRDIEKSLNSAGLVMPKTRAEYRALTESQIALGESGAQAAAALLKNSAAFASITQGQEDLAQAEQDRLESALNSYKQQQKDMISIQMDAAQKQIDLFQKLFDFLDAEVKKLYGSVTSTAEMQVREARAIVDKAQKTGNLGDPEILQDAVGTITGSMTSNKYASKFEMDRDKLRFAAQLDDLKDTAGKNLQSAKSTFDLLKLQLESIDQLTVTNISQLNVLNSIDETLKNGIGTGSGGTGGGTVTPTKPQQLGGHTGPSSGTGVVPRVDYGSEEALTSFDKFKAWYADVRGNADPKTLMDEGYKVPDWMRFHNGADDATDKEQFGSYLFFKNNPQYAKDLEQIMATGRSSYSTDGSTLVKSDLSKMPKEAADFYRGNTPALLGAEAFGLDPVLSYQLYTKGPQQFGLDGRKQSFTEWLQTHKWTEAGLVDSNNVVSFGMADWQNYNSAKWQTSTGNIIDVDGTIYTKDGKRIGMATAAEYAQVYGANKKPLGSVEDTSRQDYLNTIRNNTDDLINKGWTAQQLADAIRDTGTSMTDIAAAYGIPVSQVVDNLKAGGATSIPGFAKGGAYGGGLALVGEDGPEVINFNRGGHVSTAAQTRAALSQMDLSEQLALLNTRMEMISAENRSIAVSNNKMAKLLDRVSPDGNTLQVVVVTPTP